MAGRLLFFILIYSFHRIQAQDLRPPILTVNPPVITVKDSVTLNCQTPSSVSVSQCHFRIDRGSAKAFSCRRTLTATELLNMSHQSSPAEVEVICFYIVKHGATYTASPQSYTSSITIQNLPPPKLTVNPAVITETDSVTLNCQTPSSVSVYQCYIYTVSGENVRGFSCQRTLTGTELLLASSQSSPAEVKVRCFYTVKTGQVDSPSPHSNTSSIIIQSQKPQMSVEHFQGDHVLFTCSLSGSASNDTKCNLYIGEASRPVLTTTIRRTKTKNNQCICQFSVTIDDLLRHLHLVQQRDASCDYSSGSEPNSLSPRSDGRSLTDIVEKEPSTAPTQSAFITTKDLTTGLSSGASVFVTPVAPQISDIVEHSTQTKPTTPTTVSRPHASTSVTPAKQTSGVTVDSSSSAESFVSTSLTPVKTTSVSTSMNMSSGYTITDDITDPTPHEPITKDRATPSGLLIRKLIVFVAGFGVIMGVFSLGLALLCNRRTGKRYNKRTQANVTGDFVRMTNLDNGELLPAGNDEAYSVITSVPGVDCPTGSGKLDRKETQNADTAIYHVYATISEEPPPSALKDMVYSTVQPH